MMIVMVVMTVVNMMMIIAVVAVGDVIVTVSNVLSTLSLFFSLFILGTGKTMLAKSIATEGGANFLAIDTSVIENKWLGK